MMFIGGNVTRILRRGKVPLKKGLTSLSFINTTCTCAPLKMNHSYFIAGHEDVAQGKLLVLQNGLVKPGMKKWFLRLKKWENRIKSKAQKEKNGEERRTRKLECDKTRTCLMIWPIRTPCV